MNLTLVSYLAVQSFKERALASAVGSDNRGELSAMEMQINAVERTQMTIINCKIFNRGAAVSAGDCRAALCYAVSFYCNAS
jgi:hypothetical protein